MNQQLENKLEQFNLIKYRKYFLSLYNKYPVYDTNKEITKLHNNIRQKFPNGIPIETELEFVACDHQPYCAHFN